ncbi:MAG: hypothetical protein IPF44_02560 [Betaproteobacteria bacterium]|nr:hypothetical protein [Betaproteobacteria bacterium]
MQEQRQNFDCSKAGNPQQCEARKMAYKECQGQAGPPSASACNRKCRRPIAARPRTRPAASCTQKARAACQDKIGPEHKVAKRNLLGSFLLGGIKEAMVGLVCAQSGRWCRGELKVNFQQ